MTKTSKQIIDEFFLEHLGIDPEQESEKKELSPYELDELFEMAQHVIGLRISLRSSGRIKDDLMESLTQESLNLFQLNEQQLNEFIERHSQTYKTEKQDH